MNGIIGVIPVDTEKYGIPSYQPPPDRTKIVCELCGEKCWIGPGQRTMKSNNPSFPIICPKCLHIYDKNIKEEELKIIKLGD